VRALAVCGLAAAILCLAGSAGAGSYFPPPGDHAPVWSPDASVLVFLSERDGPSLRVVDADGADEHRIPWLPATNGYSFSPDWSHVAGPLYENGSTRMIVERLDGSDRRSLAESVYGTKATWSPDGTRVAFVVQSATPNRSDVVVARIDGSEVRRIADGFDPAWSPTDDRIAYVAGDYEHTRLHVVHADGSGDSTLTPDSVGYGGPEWSPDGTRLAVVHRTSRSARGSLEVLRAGGAPLASISLSILSDFAWSPSGDTIAYSTGYGVFLFDVASGRRTQAAAFGSQAAWSPDGSRLAFVSGGECRDRAGVYRLSLDGSRPVRLTNDCRIVGTGGDDTLTGTALADVLVGLGGDDRLTGVSDAYVGDTLEAGPGKDILVGSFSSDRLAGGPGPDVLRGGPSGDVLIGGPGPDRIDGQGGRDVVYARDGEHDVVSCGTNAGRAIGPEADLAYVDRLDSVSGDCEYVFRPGAAPRPSGVTSLRIRVWPEGQRGPKSPRRDYTLRCRPAGGTLPRPGVACMRLARIQNPFAPPPPGQVCAFVYGGDQFATVSGTYGGRAVRTSFSRVTACEIARWNRLAFLFPVRVG
jgi:Tol biopolymer transport system component